MKMRQARMARILAGMAGAGWLAIALASVCVATPRAHAATDASSQIQAAQRQFNAGNYSGAIATLQSAVTQNPYSADAYYCLVRSYYDIRYFDNAITAAE
jgi:Tfp pilus assembly protein PilF